MVGGPQLLIILLVVLVLFGGKKLPELARSLGTAKREFESGIADSDRDGSARRSELPERAPETTPGEPPETAGS